MFIKKGDKIKQFTNLRVLIDKMKKGGFDTKGLVPIDMQSPVTPVASWTTQLSAVNLSTSLDLCPLNYMFRLGFSYTVIWYIN